MNNKRFVNGVNVVVRGKCRKKITETDQKGTIFLTTQIPSDSENKPRGLYFSKALFEGVIFGGAYVWREICASKSIGLDCSGKEIYHFCFVLLCIRDQIPCTSPWGAYIRRGNLTEGFLHYDFKGLIFGGAYFQKFTVIFIFFFPFLEPLLKPNEGYQQIYSSQNSNY